jgi:hypothetical protein
MRRLGPAVESSILSIAVIAVVATVLSLIAIVPPNATSSTDLTGDSRVQQTAPRQAQGPGSTVTAQQGSGATVAGGGGSNVAGARGVSGAVARATGTGCNPTQNGGATDVGVTATTIKLAATIVTDGPGASFLAPEQIGLNAVVNKLNRAGGICGRRRQLELNNDS